MIEMLLFDLTTAKRYIFPALPLEGALTFERPQSLAQFPILGSTPQVQVAAVGVRTCTIPLELHSAAGQTFFEDAILPSYGDAPDYSPHLVRVSWGPSAAKNSFTGRPVGQPPTRIQLSPTPGQIFLHSFDWLLTETLNTTPRTVDSATNLVVPSIPTTTYRAVQGDTLQSVAKRFKVSLEDLYAANGPLPWALTPGQIIKIPRR